MRRILRRREIVADDWIQLGEDAADGAALIVPLAELRKDPGRWWQWSGRLGVRLTPVDRVEELADELPRLDLVAVEFPTPVDGRGYSQVFLRARCGFDAMELADGEDADAARRALQRYDVAYQPGSPETAIRSQRFFAT